MISVTIIINVLEIQMLFCLLVLKQNGVAKQHSWEPDSVTHIGHAVPIASKEVNCTGK